MKKKKLTAVSAFHIFRLVYRSCLFLLALTAYIVYRIKSGSPLIVELATHPLLIWSICAVYIFEMITRFFPSSLESPGSQKQFARNYVKTGKTEYRIQDNHGTVLVALIWVVFNGIFGIFYMTGIFDDGIMLLLCCAFSVCDMICILFFCPFQTWFLKNKCCCTCRIYNWDYAMMFTPLFFLNNIYAWVLLFFAVALMIRWEVTFYLHPERFAEETNGYLTCANCTEKLCHHKKQLHSLWVHVANYTKNKVDNLKTGI